MFIYNIIQAYLCIFIYNLISKHVIFTLFAIAAYAILQTSHNDYLLNHVHLTFNDRFLITLAENSIVLSPWASLG